MVSDGSGEHIGRLWTAAAATRDLLARSTAKRWEVFAKASSTREVEIRPANHLQVTEVEETGVAVRTFRADRAGFAAASGLEADASRRAVVGAFAIESPTAHDPLPPARLLGTSTRRPPRPLPPPGWAAHTAHELAQAVASLGRGALRLRRTILQEGTYSWILATGEGSVASHDGSSIGLLVEVDGIGERLGVWRDWFHVADANAFDPLAIASRIADRALLTRSRIATESGLRDLILHPEVAAHLLAAIGHLFLATPGAADSLATIVDSDGRLATRALTLVDDRDDPDAPITGPCDGEGLPARRILLLDEGIPRHRIGCYRDTLRCSETPRGGALRVSFRDYPASGIANLRVVTTDGQAATSLLESADRALYLLRPLAAVRCDAVADEYRIIASGVWLDGAKVCGWHPVVELRGSLGRMLRRIEAVGTDLAWFQSDRGFIGAPSILIRRQPVVG